MKDKLQLDRRCGVNVRFTYYMNLRRRAPRAACAKAAQTLRPGPQGPPSRPRSLLTPQIGQNFVNQGSYLPSTKIKRAATPEMGPYVSSEETFPRKRRRWKSEGGRLY
ncbi:hypothetical protein EVAR_48113_1 [Eumeta japonica]|uniref:Uncharacterized protein n=1 Tax=Eumeta variegata TaxID=151549 RepID=A0A4C1XMU4_EUMVA|nr:hypothetical protein EVAR_48113_1 [Eumeta japonica]